MKSYFYLAHEVGLEPNYENYKYVIQYTTPIKVNNITFLDENKKYCLHLIDSTKIKFSYDDDIFELHTHNNIVINKYVKDVNLEKIERWKKI